MESFRPESIPNPAVRRLSLYLRQLEAFARKGRRTISSKQLGESLRLTDAQVRKDLAYFGQFGHPGIGYRVEDLILQLRKILGTDRTWNVLLVGAGNIGRALSAYRGFGAKGFQVVAVFDVDPTKVGHEMGEFTVQHLDDIAKAVEELSEDQREVFLMRQVANLPFKEIAEITGVPENTVKSRMRYALERLQTALSEYEEYARALR